MKIICLGTLLGLIAFSDSKHDDPINFVTEYNNFVVCNFGDYLQTQHVDIVFIFLIFIYFTFNRIYIYINIILYYIIIVLYHVIYKKRVV